MAEAVEIEVNGKIYRGTYTTDRAGDTITVTHDDRTKTAKLGGSPSAIAPTILRELITAR
jgi:hypothetical protein